MLRKGTFDNSNKSSFASKDDVLLLLKVPFPGSGDGGAAREAVSDRFGPPLDGPFR